jgi:hypothetical protein
MSRTSTLVSGTSTDDQSSIDNSSIRPQSSAYSGNPSQSTLQRQGSGRHESNNSMSSAAQYRLSSHVSFGSDGPSTPGPPNSGNSVSNEGGITSQITHATQQIKSLLGRASISSEEKEPSTGSKEDPEDTMRNLRKTFAGIFGDM